MTTAANNDEKENNKQKCDIGININAIETQFAPFSRVPVEAFLRIDCESKRSTGGCSGIVIRYPHSRRRYQAKRTYLQIDDLWDGK